MGSAMNPRFSRIDEQPPAASAAAASKPAPMNRSAVIEIPLCKQICAQRSTRALGKRGAAGNRGRRAPLRAAA